MSARRVAFGAWLAWTVVTLAPFVQAWAWPPAGRRFTGFFLFQDDLYQYLSFAEQAGRGVFFFQNKYDLRPHEGFLLNLEWWSAGLLGRPFGSPLVGFHVLGALAAGLFVAASARVLGALGLAQGRLAWGLALVLTGGGLGWLRTWQGAPLSHVPDLSMSLYPFQHRALGSAHGLLGTALLLWTLLLHARWRDAAGARWPWLACATLLGLVRPFDLGLFVLVAGLLAAGTARHGLGGALRQAAELAWLLPVLFYDVLAYRLYPAFALWSGPQNVVVWPPGVELVYALGPAALLALWGLRARGGPGGALRAALWTALAATVALMLSGAGFALQFTNSLGAVLLLLAAAGLPASVAPVATLLLAPTSLLLLWRFFNPMPQWFPPRDYLAVTDALARSCGAGDVALASPELGLLISGRAPCRVVVGHRVLTPDFDARRAEVARFYTAATTPAERLAYLESTGTTRLVLPAGAGPWLGDAPPFARRLALPRLELWERTP